MISEDKRMISVADGVGGHEKREVCSGKCSKYLTRRFGELFTADPKKPLEDILWEAQQGLKDN